MKVLLISPLPGLDPACGDVVYTQNLLADPPPGVEYVTYQTAMEKGWLVENAKRNRVGDEPVLTATNKLINMIRSKRLLFWEPFRFFTVKPGIFDLIHLHVFSARFFDPPCPIVVSNAAPLRYLYTEARGYSSGRVFVIEHIERLLGKMLGINHNSYDMPQAALVIAFTEYLRDWYVRRQIMPCARVDVVPIYVRDQPVRTTRASSPRRVGFVAKDFEAKGGPVLLRAWEQVRRERDDAELTIVGSTPQLSEMKCRERRIDWRPYIPLEELLEQVLPSLDVFAYPTQFDGQPLVLLEAMAAGLAIVTSNYQAMPEMVNHGEAGKVVAIEDDRALAAAILELLEPDTNNHYRQAARDWFTSNYSAEVVRPLLRAVYDKALTVAAVKV